MLIMPASKYRGVKRLVQDASPIIESKKQRRSRPSGGGGGKAPTNLIPSMSDNLLTTALTLITKGTPGVFTTPKTTFATNSAARMKNSGPCYQPTRNQIHFPQQTKWWSLRNLVPRALRFPSV